MQSPYQVLQDWQRYYGGNLLIVLPDAFGTAAFLRDAPDWVADWTGFRPDSAPPIEGGEKIIAWWRDEGRRPRKKLLIFSDGLDVETIEETYKHFRGKVRMAFGWGTNLTNDFEDCAPTATTGLDAISLVCKVTEANGRPAVKLSDNPAKATGDPKEIARYIKLFGETDRVGSRQGVSAVGRLSSELWLDAPLERSPLKSRRPPPPPRGLAQRGTSKGAVGRTGCGVSVCRNAEAFAHASDRGHVLLLPTGHYIVGGAIAVAASFLALVLLPSGVARPLCRNAPAAIFA